MWTEEDFLPLSGLQHLIFCERQAALIHLEQIWADNALTVEGSHLHARADSQAGESRGDIRIVRGLTLRSPRLGLVGRADVVEFRRLAPGEENARGAISLPGVTGLWRLIPVEYKRGRPKAHRADEVQLCAQGLCLEEMLGAEVSDGALFYGLPRRRTEVAFDPELRRLTEETAARFHEIMGRRTTPMAVLEPKCERCSLRDACLPNASTKSAQNYLGRFLRAIPDWVAEEGS